jgi:3-oxoacyl-[acyl-carrier protein] reductase
MAERLQGRVALITGGGTGIGRSVSLALAAEGCDVAINYSRSRAEAELVADEVRACGRRALPIQADVSDDAAVRRMVRDVTSTLGGLDILVNNAGTTRFTPLDDLEAVTDEDWDRVLGVNLRGPFYCVRAALPYLRRSGRGKVINTASNSAFRPTGSSIPYMTSKAGLVTLTRVLAKALAPNVQVNAIAPGWLATRWAEQFVPREVREKIFARVAPASLDDVARTVVYLAKTDSVTGETIIIDRGENL